MAQLKLDVKESRGSGNEYALNGLWIHEVLVPINIMCVLFPRKS